jgi:chromosome partitioning protein
MMVIQTPAFMNSCMSLPFEQLIITIASSKGGVGKSTTVANLAGAFAHAGHAVEIIDRDDNLTISRWFTGKTQQQLDKLKKNSFRLPHPSIGKINVSAGDRLEVTTYLHELKLKHPKCVVLIDVPGLFERGLAIAAARSHLTIAPLTLTEADVHEAHRTMLHVEQIFNSFGREPVMRGLLNKMKGLQSHANKHAANEIKRLSIPLLKLALGERAAYEEIGFSGIPPHFADHSRPTVGKALPELDALRDEIIELAGEVTVEPIASYVAGVA